MELWKPIRIDISHYHKLDSGNHTLSLKVVTTEKMNEETGEVKWFYRIISRNNPLPVKGEFESSFKILDKWLFDNGWFRVANVKETVLYQYR